MKLETIIKPRRDGTVLARFGEVLYTFVAGEDGTLACDVTDDAHVAHLLNTGNFYPADPESFEEAAALVADPADEGEDEADDEGDENAAPVEAGTPPVARRKKRKQTEQ